MNNFTIHPAVRALSDEDLAKAFTVCNGLEGTAELPPEDPGELEDWDTERLYQHCRDNGCPLYELCRRDELNGNDLSEELLTRFRKLSGARLGDFRKDELA